MQVKKNKKIIILNISRDLIRPRRVMPALFVNKLLINIMHIRKID